MTSTKTPATSAAKTSRVPLPRDPMFVRLHGGAVHVVDNRTTAGYQRDAIADPALDPYLTEPVATRRLSEGPEDPFAHLLGIVRTRCGREIVRNRGGLGASGSFVATFDDIDLCGACHRTVAPEDQGRLFDHEQDHEQDQPAWLTRTCSLCGAHPHFPCESPGGYPRDRPNDQRLDDAAPPPPTAAPA